MSKNVARSEYSQQDILQVYPFPFVFIFLLTACNKIKIHRGNEIKERYKIFENKAELESFWNDENIIKRSKFPREKDPTTQWQYQCVLFKLDISENSFFGWTNGKTLTWNVATWLNQEPQFFWTPLIVTQNHWQYKTRDSIVFNGKTLSQIAKIEYYRLRLPYIKTTLNFVAISSGFWWGGFWVKKKITKRFINKTSYNITFRYVYLHPLKDRNSSSLIFVKYVVFTDSLTYPLIKFVWHIETEISGIWHFFLF